VGFLLKVDFRKCRGAVLSRQDEEGNFLVKEMDSMGVSYYRVVDAPPIPADVRVCHNASCVQSEDTEYVQMSDDVFVDLSCFHPLMHISRLFVYSYGVRGGVEQVELMLSFPRGYGNKIERQLDLYCSNRAAVGQRLIADNVLFQGADDFAVYNIVNIQIISQEELTEIKLLLHSQSMLAKKRRLNRLMQSNDLICTFVLNKGKREFMLGLGKRKDNKKGQ